MRITYGVTQVSTAVQGAIHMHSLYDGVTLPLSTMLELIARSYDLHLVIRETKKYVPQVQNNTTVVLPFCQQPLSSCCTQQSRQSIRSDSACRTVTWRIHRG